MKKKDENNNSKIKKDSSNDLDPDAGKYFNFIKINRKYNIEKLSNEEHIQQLLAFSKLLTLENEDNIGQEMNKFFNIILSENKEGEPLKVNIAISNRLNRDKKINKALDIILNKKENKYIVLTQELCENISLILTNIYQKIKNKGTITNFKELLEKINEFNYSEKDILKKYIVNRDRLDKNDELNQSPQKSKDFTVKINSGFSLKGQNNKEKNKNNKNSEKGNKISNIQIIDNYINVDDNDNDNDNEENINKNIKNEEKIYRYKESKEDNKYEIPPEMLILRRKFQMVTKMKLIISKNYRIKNKSCNNNKFSSNGSDINNSINDVSQSQSNNEYTIKKRDVDNNIFVLLNLSWLFPQLIEIEIDLTNEDIIKDQIELYKSGLIMLTKLIKRNLKKTYYHSDIIKEKINFDPLRGSIFPNYNQLQEEEEISENDSDSYSLEIAEFKDNNPNNKINGEYLIINDNKFIEYKSPEDNKNFMNHFDNFINKYQYTLQMIIIYGYFISKIQRLFFCNFTLPINLEREMIRMLQIYGIFFDDFMVISFLSDIKMIKITYDFNSLDNNAFQQILSLLYKHNNLHVCQLNCFPSENNIELELLFKLLQDANSFYKNSCLNLQNLKIGEEILPNEDLDIFILRKLSEFFEANMDKLFQTICIQSTVSELSLIFNYPLIINRIDHYLMILLKFIMNLFIAIDIMKLNLTSFILQANNFFFDSRKYPFLIDFLDSLEIYENKEIRLSKLICQMKFVNISNLYRIIPYNINEISIGEFDYESFACFVEYITSAEFSVHSKLSKLKIKLSQNVFDMDIIYDYLLMLLTEYPKNLKEISVDTYLSITYEQLNNLLKCTDYNTIENIVMTFSKRSLDDKGFDGKIKNEILDKENILSDENYIDIKYVGRTIKAVKLIKNNIMMNLCLKYNKKFMDYNIFKNLEKFVCKISNKKYLIQFK